jgi:signal recognition particle subunit SRP19
MKLHGKIIVWPANIDSTKTRRTGRKLTKGAALQNPRLDELRDAANLLTLEHEALAAKSRPSTWWEKGGYLVVTRTGPRSAILRSLASEIRKQRAAREKDRKI